MKLICGLGNPGRDYEATRHNAGFLALDEIARGRGADWRAGSFEGRTAECGAGAGRWVLLKPETFMNLSGRCVGAAAKFWKLPPDDVLVMYDDVDLPFGQLRFRRDGSSGGHRGAESVIAALGAGGFHRLKIGVGRNSRMETRDHVLGEFAPDERAALPDLLKRAAAAAGIWAERGIAEAMQRVHGETKTTRGEPRNEG